MREDDIVLESSGLLCVACLYLLSPRFLSFLFRYLEDCTSGCELGSWGCPVHGVGNVTSLGELRGQGDKLIRSLISSLCLFLSHLVLNEHSPCAHLVLGVGPKRGSYLVPALEKQPSGWVSGVGEGWAMRPRTCNPTSTHAAHKPAPTPNPV